MDRPLLKGVSHLIATGLYILLFPHLFILIPDNLKFPLIVYLASAIGNFASSALFHFINWSPNTIIYFRRLDHLMIFVLIIATYYAMISTFIPDVNILVKYVLGIGSVLGIINRLFFTDAHSLLVAIPYILVGWSIILDPYGIMSIFDRSLSGAILAVLASISYNIGAIIYVFKYPKLWPHIMGYHELFHIFVIIGTSLFTVCIFFCGIPYYNKDK